MRATWISCSVPLFVLLLALAGQLKEQVATIALTASLPLLVWSLGLVALLTWHLVRKTPAHAPLWGLSIASSAALALVALVLEAPMWVRWNAEPAIAAIERERAESGKYPNVDSLDGDFPRPLRATLEISGHCLYKPRGASYHLSCLGVPFAKCGYDGATQRWSGWE